GLPVARRPVAGRSRLARFFAWVVPRYAADPRFADVRLTVAEVNGQPAVLAWSRGSLLAVVILDADGRMIAALWLGAAPGKLAAAAAAARAGARVIILEAGAVGGRARTQVRDGFRFNQGPHALFRGGPGRRVLSRLGIETTGHAPSLRRPRALIAGRARRFPLAQTGRAIGRVAATRPSRWEGASAADWIGSLGLRDDTAALMEAGVRVTT